MSFYSRQKKVVLSCKEIKTRRGAHATTVVVVEAWRVLLLLIIVQGNFDVQNYHRRSVSLAKVAWEREPLW